MKRILALSIMFFASTVFAEYTDLKYAVDNDNLSKVKGIIESGKASKDELVEAEGYPDGTPIITLAARSGSVKVAEYLISIKANVNAKTPLEESALTLACFFDDGIWGGSSGNFEKNDRIARALAEAGADLNNEGGFSPIAYGAYKNRVGIIKYLLDKGAKPDGDVKSGVSVRSTGLMYACRNDHYAVAHLLLQRGADVHVKNNAGHDAYYYAFNYKSTDILPLIECALKLKAGEKYADHCP